MINYFFMFGELRGLGRHPAGVKPEQARLKARIYHMGKTPWRLNLLALTLVTAVSAKNFALATPAAPSTGLSLSQAIAAALSSSAQIRAAEAGMRAQVERRRGAWAGIGPRIKLDYNDIRFEKAQTANFVANVREVNDNIVVDRVPVTLRGDRIETGSAMLIQPITGLLPLIEIARNEGTLLGLKELELENTKRTVAYATAEAWVRAKQSLRLLAIAEASVQAAESQLKDARALERAGRLNRADALRLELAVSEAKVKLAEARAGEATAIMALREAMGLGPEASLDLGAELPRPSSLKSGKVETAYADSAAKRLEVKMAKQGVEVADFGTKVAWSQFSPSINVFAKLERNFGEPAGLGGSKEDQKSYGINASWDIWSNGSSVFAVRQAAEERAKAEAMVQQAETLARVELTQADANLKASHEALALAELAVKQAEEAYRMEQARFRTGSRSATDLVLAESAQAGARGRLVLATANVWSWQWKLQKAAGVDAPSL